MEDKDKVMLFVSYNFSENGTFGWGHFHVERVSDELPSYDDVKAWEEDIESKNGWKTGSVMVITWKEISRGNKD